jgi:hypothetical protein
MPMSDCVVTVKGKVSKTIPADVINQGFSDEVYNAIFAEGLKTVLSKGLTGIKATDREAIEAKVEENLEILKSGRVPGRAASKATPASTGLSKGVLALAMKKARARVDIILVAAGRKPQNCKAPDKTRLARELLAMTDEGPPIIEEAKAEVAAMLASATATAAKLHIEAVHEDPIKVSMNKARAQRAKESKAGKVKTQAVPARRGRPPADFELRPQA